MKKEQAKNLYFVIRRLDAKSVDSELRTKMLANTIATKKIATELEEAEKTLQESLTDKEREADRTVSELNRKQAADKAYLPSEAETKAVEIVNNFNKVANATMKGLFEAKADIKLKKITAEELDKLADSNPLTFDALALISELLVG